MKLCIFHSGVLQQALSDAEIACLRNQSDIYFIDTLLTADNFLEQTPEDLTHLVGNACELPETLLAQRPKLQQYILLGTGFDPLSVNDFAQHGITLKNCPTYGIENVAQFTLSLILQLCSLLPQKNQADWTHIYGDGLPPIIEIKDRTVGIIGYGKTSQRLIALLRPFSPNFLVYSHYPQHLPDDCQQVSLNTLLNHSDLITLHSRGTQQNRHLINLKNYQQIKRGALLVNTARGSLIDERAILAALNEGYIGAAALDVLETEPPHPENPLLTHPNCYITPHCACNSREAKRRITLEVLAHLDLKLQK